MEWMQTHSSHRYPTSLTDEEWEQIKSLVPTPKSGVGKRGRPIGLERRELADAIFYIVRSGCSWRMLPSDFGPCRQSMVISESGVRIGLGGSFTTRCAIACARVRAERSRRQQPL